MAFGVELETEDCPPFLAGENCTETWWDAISSEGYNLFHFILVLYAICSAVALWFLIDSYLLKLNKDADSCSLKLRMNTLASCAATGISIVLFVALGAHIRFPPDSLQGKLSLVSLLLVNTFSIQNAQDLLVMYVKSTNHSLLRKGILETVDSKTLTRLLIAYDMWIVNFILTGIIFVSPSSFPSEFFVIRLSFSMTAIHIAFLAFALPRYLRNLSNLLRGVLKSTEGNGRAGIDPTQIESWKRLEKDSRQLALYLSVAGPSMSIVHFVASFSPILTYIQGYYAFLLFWMGGHSGLVIGQLLVLRPSNRQSTSKASKPASSYGSFTTVGPEHPTVDGTSI